MRLTDKQLDYVRHYAISMNAVEAARAAGYAKPKEAARALQRHPDVARAVLEEREKHVQDQALDIAYIQRRLAAYLQQELEAQHFDANLLRWIKMYVDLEQTGLNKEQIQSILRLTDAVSNPPK